VNDGRAADSAAADWIKRNFSYVVFAIAFILFVFPHISPWEGLNENLRFIQRFSEWILGKLESLFAEYGYWVVFIGVLIENSMFLGFLVPGAIILILAGLSAENGSINIWYVLGLAIVATMIGDTISYWIGRLGWIKVLERFRMMDLVERVRGPMESNSTWIILGYHLAGYSRAIGPAAAGIFRIPFKRWAPIDYLGGTIWVLLYTGIGYALGIAGVEFGDTKRMVNIVEIVLLGMFAFAIFVAFAKQMRDKSAAGASGQPATVIVPVDDDSAA
jgi:membrane protein DedA with SNARE-associated domain